MKARRGLCSPEEGGGNSKNNGASLLPRMSAVIHVPYDSAVRGDHRACSGGGHTQEEHGLAAEELSYAGPQDFATISLSVEEKDKIICTDR